MAFFCFRPAQLLALRPALPRRIDDLLPASGTDLTPVLPLLVWLSAWLALSAAGLAIWNMALYRAPPRPRMRHEVSVLIPARDEEANIASAIDAVRANTDADIEIIVLDDHSSDRTAAIVARIAAEDGRVRLAQAPPLPPGWSGKQHACHVLGGLARHELLVFVDADVRLASDAVGRMAAFMAERPSVGLASGVPLEVTGTMLERLLLTLIPFLLLGFLPLAGMRRSLHPAFGAGCGQLFIARGAAYRTAGGHQSIMASLHDGVTLPRSFRRAGQMTDLFDAVPIARCRMYRGAGEVWSGLSKNATEGLARPVALPIWTVLLVLGQVLPLPLLAAACWSHANGGSGGLTLAAAAAAVVGSLGLRLALAWRFRSSLIGAALHPLGVAILLSLQWQALARARGGRPASWRGRAYPQP